MRVYSYIESNIPNLVALPKEFYLDQKSVQVVMDNFIYFLIEDIRVGSTTRKSIPLLMDLLRLIPDRPGAPPIVVQLLTHIADGSDTNKLTMAEVGTLDTLTKYLPLSPQESSEAIMSELLRILFTNLDLLCYEASISSLNQLITVLHLESRNARFSAARASHEFFDAKNIRDYELARQMAHPLVDVHNVASESEQQAALIALIKLTMGNSSKSI